MADDARTDRADSEHPKDIAILQDRRDDGSIPIVRLRQDRVEVGLVRELAEGKPIIGEVVKLTPRKSTPRICDVDVVLPSETPVTESRTAAGPAQVATERYRDNWDMIFGAKRANAALN